nr:cytochrome P450 4AV17 [Meteorus pulchricornis]
MFPILITLLILVIAYATYSFAIGKPPNSPPTIWRFPVWGSYWVLLWGNYQFPHNTIHYYMKKFNSKIIGCWLGPAYTVILNDYESVKEVLSRKEFDGRLHELYPNRARAFGKKLGIFFNDGWEWQEQRRFALHNLRNFGFGRRHAKLENDLAEELDILVCTIKNGPINDDEKQMINNDRVLFPTILFPVCANIIWAAISGERIDRTNHESLREVCHSARCFQKGGDTTGGAISITSWLSSFGNMFGFHDFINGNQGMIDFVKRYLNRIQKENSIAEPEGFLTAYLQKIKEVSHNNEYFSEEQMIMIAVDFMFPALSAVPSVITHCIKYLMHHPEKMDRVQNEIESVIGKERLPQWDDRKKLPFTEAVIRETLRIEPLTPWSVAHKCVETTTLQNYTISAGTIIITNLAAMHSDEEFWGDPDIFRPERFLDDNSKLGKDWTLPFGFGRRVCAGETFARFVLFEIIATLLQKFNWTMIQGQPTNLDDKIPGIIVQPMNAWIRVSSRT